MSAQEAVGSAGVGTASGALANFARGARVPPVEPDRVTSALRRVADQRGVRVTHLRMIDYRHALANGYAGPTLAEVMATFGTWSTARSAAGGA